MLISYVPLYSDVMNCRVKADLPDPVDPIINTLKEEGSAEVA